MNTVGVEKFVVQPTLNARYTVLVSDENKSAFETMEDALDRVVPATEYRVLNRVCNKTPIRDLYIFDPNAPPKPVVRKN